MVDDVVAAIQMTRISDSFHWLFGMMLLVNSNVNLLLVNGNKGYN